MKELGDVGYELCDCLRQRRARLVSTGIRGDQAFVVFERRKDRRLWSEVPLHPVATSIIGYWATPLTSRTGLRLFSSGEKERIPEVKIWKIRNFWLEEGGSGDSRHAMGIPLFGEPIWGEYLYWGFEKVFDNTPVSQPSQHRQSHIPGAVGNYWSGNKTFVFAGEPPLIFQSRPDCPILFRLGPGH